MPPKPRFSKCHNYGTAKEITIREAAPENLRYFTLQTAKELGWGPASVRPIICGVLRVRPDDNNWSEYPNIDFNRHDPGPKTKTGIKQEIIGNQL